MSLAFSPSRMRRATARGFLAQGIYGSHRPTKDFVTEEGIVIRENRSICRGSEPSKRGTPFIHHARSVNVHQLEKTAVCAGSLDAPSKYLRTTAR